MSYPRHPRTDPQVMTPAEHRDVFDRTFWAVCFPIAIIGSVTWLAIFEYNYHPRLSRYSKGVTILRVGDSELDFNHPAGTFTIPRQTGRRNVRVWPRYRETP